MRNPLRTLALACAIALTPACASLKIGQTRIENPIAAAHTLDQRAYALISAYAAILEEATDVIRAPTTPNEALRPLAEAERAATPAVETLEIALAAYLRAREEFEASASADQPTLERVTTALTIAARHLEAAIGQAQPAIETLQSLTRPGA